jgi:hypothetical protein
MFQRNKKLEYKCINCGKGFHPWPGKLRLNSKFCCRRCSLVYQYKKDKNLGKKLTMKALGMVARLERKIIYGKADLNIAGVINLFLLNRVNTDQSISLLLKKKLAGN